ncbi:PorV/PorQ family protein [Salisaeta longa]|uniref:hypothetical protein n=1 Tax=Salisaeta longa TaxID=503170 RepID=UPI0003B5E35C|nr:hypothetical protein [Salisaeta longa]
MRVTCGLILCCWLYGSVAAQSTTDLLGHARSSALGSATTALASDVGVHSNPAAWATRAARAVTFFARQAYGLAELRYGALQYLEPTGWGTLAGGLSTFGFSDYREVHVSAGYARGVSLGTSRTLFAGATARYYHTAIAGYGSAGALAFNAGLLFRPRPALAVAAHATNLHGAALGGHTLPQTLALGAAYAATERVTVVADVFKQIRYPLAVRGGVEVHPVDVLALRAGITTAPTRFTSGVGLRLGRLAADLAVTQHLVLGWTPAASLSIHW